MKRQHLWIVLLGLLSSGVWLSAAEVVGLRTEYRTNPLGIDVVKPRLSWVINSEQRGEKQTAYQILVASTPELLIQEKGDLWDSKKVSSDRQNQIEYAGRALESRMTCHWKVRVWDKDGAPSAWSQPSLWSMGLLNLEDWKAQWIGVEQNLAPKPPRSKTLDPRPWDNPKLIAAPEYLRKDFVVARTIRRAVVHVTALGVYELRLNGQRVGDHLLAPEWTSYSKRVQYQSFDVTSLVKNGANAMSAILGNGWYCGLWQHWPYEVRMYGDQPWLLAQLEIELEDGSRQVVVSDPTWKGTLDGPIRFSGIYEGETYDANMEFSGWDTAGFDDGRWLPVVEKELSDVPVLVWQRSEPIRPCMEIKPVSLTEPKPGVYVFDFVQNMAGWTRFSFNGRRGINISLQHGEMLNKDGTVFTGNLHLFNQADRQLDHYTFRSDGVETYEPHFTYHGFRYVEVRGLTEKPDLNNFTGVVFHSDCPEVGEFSCSNPQLTRLAQNILWSQRANFMGVPTDCPQRDERCGYPGDAQFFMPTAVYNMDVAAFFNKCLVDLCQDSANEKSGAFGDHMPDFQAGGYGNVGWGDAGIICPYVYYRTYGDTRLIREHYEAMRRHLQTWIDKGGPSHSGGIRNSAGPRDWLNLKCPTKSEVIATAYFAYLCDLMAEMGEAIGKTDDIELYRKTAAETREAFAKAFIAEDGSIQESSQTGFALAFTMGLVPEAMKTKMADRFADEIRKFNSHLATGFIGTPRLLPGLHQAGLDDIAYQLLLTDTPPSWLYEVKVGGTTMWERWDGWDGVNPKGGMNSLNHYAFGAVGEYLFGMVGGIQPDAPGYKKIKIAPVIRAGLTWANTRYDSIRGRIISNWKHEGDTLTIDVTIPANTSASVFVPAQGAASVSESGKPISQTDGVKFIRMEGNAAVFEIGSGTYHFQSSLLK